MRHLYPHGWKEISRRVIKERGSKCENCFQSEAAGRQYHNPLTVHHIDYNPANDAEENKVVLCAACHLRRQNSERKLWHGKPIPKEQLHLPF